VKITWLDPEMTRVRVERGWFRRVSAELRIGTYDSLWGMHSWVFVDGDAVASFWLRLRINAARDGIRRRRIRAKRRGGWKPVASLPVATAKDRGDER